MATDYWNRIARAIKAFSEPGDDLVCVRIAWGPERNCELCGHFPIKKIHTLKNQRTAEELRIGRECIRHYKVVHEARFGEQAKILFPQRYEREAQRINSKWPKTVAMLAPSQEDDFPQDDGDYFKDQYEFDIEEMAPEGMGVDEVDWDSFDWDND